MQPLSSQDLQSITKRPPVQKPKRSNKAAGDRGPNARKKNKKEDVGKSAEALIKQLKQVKEPENYHQTSVSVV